MSTPSAATIGALEAPARTSAPIRVRSTRNHSSPASATPAARIAKRYVGYSNPGMSRMPPESASGSGICNGALPQTARTPWFRNRMTPKVANTWLRWSRS